MNRPPKPKFNWLYKCASVVLILNAFVCVKSLSVMSKDMERVIQARETVGVIDRFAHSVKSAELAESHYLLTGEKSAATEVKQAIEKLDGPLGELTARSKNDPLMETRVASLRHVVSERKGQLIAAAMLRESQGIPAAAKSLTGKSAEMVWGEMIRLVVEIQAAEDQKLREATVSARLAIGRSVLTILLASALALALLAIVSYINRRELARRELAANETREREMWFSATLASISDAVIATDDKGRVRLINPVAQELTGWSLSDSKGKPLEEVFPLLCEDSRSPVENPLSQILNAGVATELSNHTLLVARDGTEHPVEHCGAPIRDLTGATTGVVLCFRDITERRRAEIELRASKESADAANRAKDQFLAVLSHELRKPLTPVLVAVTGMLEHNDFSDLGPTLEMIRRNVEMESRLIDDLLDVSRIARGGLRLHTEVVDLHETVRQALGMCHAELLLANIRVDLELSARARHVLADETRMMQVFWNLITNAAKFTGDGGRLSIQTWNEEVAGALPAPSRFVIEFRDNGIGIDPEAIGRIFEPFEQGDGGVRKRYGGLGLGLAICRGIVESHGGRLAASSPGRQKGATFRLELSPVPAPKPIAPPSPPPPTAPTAPGLLKILLVEDNPDTLRYLALVLGQRGHEVITAASLASARALLGSSRFNLLISDIELPDGSGLELMRDATGMLGIALSGFGSEEDIRMSESAGFWMHLTKPINMKSLEDAISKVMSRTVNVSEAPRRFGVRELAPRSGGIANP
jgi:PAS domain S-box-containing protein